jgi:carbon monoxide dehydrogenase subunit G
MELENSFVVPADIDTAWKTLLDVEAIAPCMPGATLTSFTGDEFTADVKVKLGPVTMNFAGAGSFVSKDESTHTVVIDASGKETKGAGTAGAKITAVLTEEGPNETRAHIVTDLTVTGKAAQFGRGVMADVSKKLIGQFAGNLEKVITAEQSGGAEAAGEAAAESGGSARAGADGAAPGASARPAPAPPPVLDNEALDLGSAAMGPVLKRAIPAVIGALVVGVLLWWLIKRK